MDSTEQPSEKKSLIKNISVLLQNWKEKLIVFNQKYPKATFGLKIGSGLMVGGLVFVFGLWLLVFLGAFGKLPSTANLKNIHNHTASEIYASDGKLLGKYRKPNQCCL